MYYRDERRTVEGIHSREHVCVATRHVQMHAASLADLLRWLDGKPKTWPAEASKMELASKNKWTLGASWKDTLRMAHEGWPEGVKQIHAKLSAIIPATDKMKRWGYAPSGSSVNVGRFLRDHPKQMRNRQRKESGTQKVLRLVVNGAASCAVSAEAMANYGVALVGLISKLESAGRRVHLDVAFCMMLNNGVRGTFGWTVKGAQDRLDLHALAFSIGHPAAFRRFGFAMLERMPKEAFSWGYGNAADIQTEDMWQNVPGAMLVDGVSHAPKRCNTPEDAVRLAIEQVNKAAVLAGHATPDSPLLEETDFVAAA